MSKKPSSTGAERKARVSDCLAAGRASVTKLMGCLVPGALVALAGCGGGSVDESVLTPATPPPPVPPTTGRSHGRFVGTVKIEDVEYFGDALVTVDGAVRLYVGAPASNTGAIQGTTPAGSTQFVGNLEVRENQASGSGVIIGQGCADPQVVRFCRETASGEIQIVFDAGQILGEIRVTTIESNEIWLLDLGFWRNYYSFSASQWSVAGQYQEELAEFALDGDTIVGIDHSGELFFQSANSGCTGNGKIAAHLDGAFNVHDVTLTIGNCSAPFTYLNGEFEGLATPTPSNYWNYDELLRIWLSKPEGAASPAAVTMLGHPLYP